MKKSIKDEPKCRKCGSHFIGKPWEIRTCSKCDTWMSPNYFHPDAPKEKQAEGRTKLRAIAQALIGKGLNAAC
ncbi:MAG: hypothetical protein JXR97_06870 [Planctomycetes bacterium]|nr:hypothetical protein [Planctomycetota bacterium]